MADAGTLVEVQDQVNDLKDTLEDRDRSELCLVSSAIGAALESTGPVREFCLRDAMYHIVEVERRVEQRSVAAALEDARRQLWEVVES